MANRRNAGRAVGGRTSKRSKKQDSLKLKDLEAGAGKKVKGGGSLATNCSAGKHYDTVIIVS